MSKSETGDAWSVKRNEPHLDGVANEDLETRRLVEAYRTIANVEVRQKIRRLVEEIAAINTPPGSAAPRKRQNQSVAAAADSPKD